MSYLSVVAAAVYPSACTHVYILKSSSTLDIYPVIKVKILLNK